jgi:SAM-dependent methyltransferase
MQYLKRQRAEKEFYDRFYKDGWEKQDQCIDESIAPPNMLVYWHLVKKHISWLKHQQPEVWVLDCGCGHGALSVLLAKIGAKVTAVDISFNSIKIATRLARTNGVEEKIYPVVAALENLPFKDRYFNCVLGTRVLHHIDVMSSGFHLLRVLKPGCKGIFWECTEKNPILRFIRNHIRRFIPLPKFGTKDEHPLTKEEIDKLGMIFGKPARIVAVPFYFFGLLDEFIFRQRAEILSKIVTGLDATIARYLPRLNRFSFHQILILEKRGAESETLQHELL